MIGRTYVDVVLGQATPIRGGTVSLGVTVDFLAAAACRASVVVVETSPAVPRTGPSSEVTPDHLLVVEGSRGPLPFERQPSKVDRGIAVQLQTLIPDDATVQLGLGAWTGAVAVKMTTRRGLRVHTGLLSDWALTLGETRAMWPAKLRSG